MREGIIEKFYINFTKILTKDMHYTDNIHVYCRTEVYGHGYKLLWLWELKRRQ